MSLKQEHPKSPERRKLDNENEKPDTSAEAAANEAQGGMGSYTVGTLPLVLIEYHTNNISARLQICGS